MEIVGAIRRKASQAKARFTTSKKDPKGIMSKIVGRRLTYLSRRKMLQLLTVLHDIERNGIEGQIIEAGCALGGSLVLIATYSPNRKISVYDTFEMIPPPGPKDPPEVHERYATIVSGTSKGISGDTYYGYRGDLREFVLDQLVELVGYDAALRTHFHKGLLQDTMNLEDPVAFAHIDVDWYDPVMTSIVRIWPLLTKGGVLVFDDYFDWGGCKAAVDEYFNGRKDMEFDHSGGNLKVTKL